MTVLCALYDEVNQELWLGCNDRALIGDTPAPGTASKWVIFGDWVIGLSGDSINEQLLQTAGEAFPHDTENVLDVFKFLRQTFEDFGHGRDKNGDGHPSYGVNGIIAHRSGRIWDFDNQLALSEVPAGRLWACGSGAEYALGADYVLRNNDKSAEERVGFAVAAAIALDVGCPGDALVGPFGARTLTMGA